MFRKSIFSLLLIMVLTMFSAVAVSAEEAVYTDAKFDVRGFNSPELLYDESKATYSESYGTPKVNVTREDAIGGVYIIFDKIPAEWTLTAAGTEESVTCGTNSFLHEYVDVSALFEGDVTELDMTFADGVVITEIYVFSKGDIPDWVQIWQPPCEKADLMMIASHSDDEQLFFAGVLPYYAVERKMNVQVVYLVSHFDTHERPHEQLDGLWTVGIRNYPVISELPDLYSESTDREEAKKQALEAYEAEGYTFDDFVSYITECIRRFKPLVVISHDTNGEYGHGTHVVCADAIAEALKCSMNSGKYVESVSEYGTWIPEKVYLHLYSENSITLNLDTKYDSLGGKSPFEVSQEGFKHHKTQLWTWFNEWIYGTEAAPITKAAQIEDYSPCKYGLYYTSVGNDIGGGDFFENVKTYAEREMDAETQTAATLAPLETLPAELAPKVDTETEPAGDADADDEDKGTSNNESYVIPAIVLVAVAICIVIMIFTAASSKTSVRSRRRKKAAKRNSKNF